MSRTDKVCWLFLVVALWFPPLPAEAKQHRASPTARRAHPARVASRSRPRPSLLIPPLSEVSAKAAVLMDAESGQVLFARNADTPMYPASCTKIMTALLALERGKLDDKVKASRRASEAEPSHIALQPGETLTLRQLLYALILKSANDAAVAIAEHIGGSVEGFADLMNQRARELGCTNTHFVTPSGLHDKRHYTTARDLALMARAALQREDFRHIITMRVVQMPRAGKPWRRVVYNKNRFLSLFEGADGVKTGFTTPAGRCFVGSATRHGWQLIAVVLRCDNIYQDAAGLLTYGFKNFQRVPLVERNEPVSRVKVVNGTAATCRVVTARDVTIPYPKHRTPLVKRHITRRVLKAPVKKGREAGALTVLVDGKIVGQVPLVTAESVALKPPPPPLAWGKWGIWGALGLLIVGGYGAVAKSHRERWRRLAARRGAAD
ncbi:MAG: D-alanyl-D-alanine carboxypeptidase family protein [Abditibacteriales bacterium]|nr:D-alanyl-D-alanine carboxypeptidase family protein [Abditibacteriales bacterium]